MKILIFGTTYVDTLEKRAIQNLWFKMVRKNLGCDLMIVDSCSPMLPEIPSDVWYYGFEDNIGHLARGGQDGWGRAFCYGLQYAVDNKYDYVVHIECDSLCKLGITVFAQLMARHRTSVLSVSVVGTKYVEKDWIETGLVFFDVNWLVRSGFVEKYNWQDGAGKRKYPHTPEAVVWGLCHDVSELLPIKNVRDDHKTLTEESVLEYDWVTHAPLRVMERFAA